MEESSKKIQDGKRELEKYWKSNTQSLITRCRKINSSGLGRAQIGLKTISRTNANVANRE